MAAKCLFSTCASSTKHPQYRDITSEHHTILMSNNSSFPSNEKEIIVSDLRLQL